MDDTQRLIPIWQAAANYQKRHGSEGASRELINALADGALTVIMFDERESGYKRECQVSPHHVEWYGPSYLLTEKTVEDTPGGLFHDFNGCVACLERARFEAWLGNAPATKEARKYQRELATKAIVELFGSVENARKMKKGVVRAKVQRHIAQQIGRDGSQKVPGKDTIRRALK